MLSMNQLKEEILKLKQQKNAVVLAHSYQSPEILEIADITGDSFALSVAAQKLSNDAVILCGVKFMADTVKILSPEKTVILPSPTATCPMAEMIDPERVRQFKKEHPDAAVVAYINTTTDLKAVADVCVTSSSALKIVSSLDAKKILFIPDKNLGSYVAAAFPEKEIILWDGFCPVHNAVSEQECLEIKKLYPDYKILMHPELPKEVVKHADVVGSTAEIMKYAKTHDENCIIGTEISISDWLSLENPDRHYPLLSKKLICADMRLTTLLDVYKALQGTGGLEIKIDEPTRLNAKSAIDRMIELG